MFFPLLFPCRKTPSKAIKRKKAHLLDIIIAQRPPILELLSRENQPLLIRWNALFVLNLGLDIVDGIARLDFESDGFTREGFHEAANAPRSGGEGSMLQIEDWQRPFGWLLTSAYFFYHDELS